MNGNENRSSRKLFEQEGYNHKEYLKHAAKAEQKEDCEGFEGSIGIQTSDKIRDNTIRRPVTTSNNIADLTVVILCKKGGFSRVKKVLFLHESINNSIAALLAL